MNPYSLQAFEDDPYLQIDPVTGEVVPRQQAALLPTAAQIAPPQSAAPRYTSQEDPRRAARDDRDWAYGAGEDQRRYLEQQRQDAANDIRFANEYGFSLHDPLAQGRGGIPQNEMERILQQRELESLQMTPEEAAQAGYSDEERAGIQGDPWSRMKWFNPNSEYGTMDETQGFRRGAVEGYARDIGGAFDPFELRARPEFYDALAAGPSEYANRTREILDPSKLTVSPEFLQQYQYSPEAQQNAITGAGITSGTRDKAAIDEMERRSRAAGMDPLAVAAMRGRMEQGMKADAADAMTRARIGTNAEAARRLQVGEQMRLSAGQNLAGMQTDAERALMDASYRAAMGGEDVRGGTERDIAERRSRAAEGSGQARIGNETALARERLGLQQSISERGGAAQRDVEGTQVERARELARQRQEADRYRQGERYNRGVGMSDRLSGRYQYGTEANRQDTREGRAYARELAQRQNQNWQQSLNRPLQLYGQQGGLMQGATRNQGQLYEQDRARPSWWEKALGIGLGAVGGFGGTAGRVARGVRGGFAKGGIVTEPTYALVGEEGPEAIIPLNGDPNAVLPPSMALRPGETEPFDVTPPSLKRRPAYAQQYRYGS